MAGNKIGAAKAKAKILAKNPNFFREIGSIGGSNGVGTLKGFAADHERAVSSGRIGGRISKRRKKVQNENQ